LSRNNKIAKFKWKNKEEEYNMPETTNVSKIIYNIKDRKYYFVVNKRVEIKEQQTEKKVISIDPGIRTFLTGISENECIKIGSNLQEKIRPYLERIDKINRKEGNKYVIPNKRRKNRENQINRKMKNIIDDFHWKIINFLTNKYSMILIGDMSSKSISSNRTGNMYEMTKRIGLKMGLYTFRERLKYKCHCKRIKYRMIRENYTSKMCSCCGKINEKLGGKKIYDCKKCGMIMDRDLNGARNIYLKSHDNKYIHQGALAK
jgi:putative transposase